MNKRIVSVIGGLVVVALLSVMAVSVVSAQDPVLPEDDGSIQEPEVTTEFECPMYQWWQENGSTGEFVRPWMDPNFECPGDCPVGGNFVDEDNDGINDNAPRAGNRWNQDDDNFGPGRMGRWNQNNNFGRGMGMNRGYHGNNNFGPGMMGRGYQNNSDNYGPGMGTGRAWSNG